MSACMHCETCTGSKYSGNTLLVTDDLLHRILAETAQHLNIEDVSSEWPKQSLTPSLAASEHIGDMG